MAVSVNQYVDTGTQMFQAKTPKPLAYYELKHGNE